MSDDCDTALCLDRCWQGKQLLDDPKTEHDEGWHIDRAYEDKKPIKHANVGAGPNQDIGSDHAADRTRSADQGHLASWVKRCMGDRAGTTAYQKEEQVAKMPHCFLDVVAVKPEEPHIAY